MNYGLDFIFAYYIIVKIIKFHEEGSIHIFGSYSEREQSESPAGRVWRKRASEEQPELEK